MNYKLNRIVLPIISFITLVALACAGGLGASPTPTPPPPTEVATDAPLPTDEPVATKPPVGGEETGTITLSDTPYTHSSGAFSITFPEGWEISESDTYAYAVSPTGEASVSVSFENVDILAGTANTTSYITAVETNHYGTFDNYEKTGEELQPDGSMGVAKTLDYDGTTYVVQTYYMLVSSTMFYTDMWTVQDQFETLSPQLLESLNTSDYEGAPDGSSLYSIRYTFICPQNFCQFDVPYSWTYTTDTSAPDLTKDRFISPDQHMVMDSFVSLIGPNLNQSIADDMARIMVPEEYRYPNLEITDETQQSDGSTRLDWQSTTEDGSAYGQTFYEVRGEYFLAWTFLVGGVVGERVEEYFGLWDELIASYAIPSS